MAFWSKWFSTSEPESGIPAKSLEYKGFKIDAMPYRNAGQWQLAGLISKDGRSHRFVRADQFSDKNECADVALTKGQLIIDQSGESIFKP